MCKRKLWRLSKKDQENEKTDLLSSDLSWLKTKGRAIAAKFYDEIIRLKKVCIYMDIIEEGHCFRNQALSQQLNEDDPQLQCNSL